MKSTLSAAAIIGVLLFLLSPLRGADTLPASLDDSTFWRMISGLSEGGGDFPYENLLSNELSYQTILPSLKKMQGRGAYLGVGPEQNFTYIAALEPRIAFVIDIRRQNMLEHLMYKALFETSADRAGFVAQLFARKRLPELGTKSSVDEIFKAYEGQDADSAVAAQTLQRVNDTLMDGHRFPLTSDDQLVIKHILDAFAAAGPQMDYGFVSPPSNIAAPTYSQLMTATDGHGRNWSYLSNEEAFLRVREMQLNNLIVPLIGDFAGDRTLRMAGAYLKQHHSAVTAFYLSNVEQYLKKDELQRFRANVTMLPLEPLSRFIRFVPPSSTTLVPINGPLFHLLNSGGPTAVQSR